MSKFTKDTGTFISLVQGAKLTQAYRIDKIEHKLKEFPLAGFFGSNKLNTLLSKPGAIGLRIYYGLDIDGDGKSDGKFVIVAVDKEGNDIIPESNEAYERGTMEDILDDGTYCPFDCSAANALNSDKG